MKVVFDIDGTLANLDHRLHFIQPEAGEKKNWKGFFEACVDDTPIFPTVQLCKDLISEIMDGQFRIANKIEFWTGRNEDVRLITEQWLAHHLEMDIWDIGSDELGGYFPLKMRSKGDRRPDYIIKMEFIDWDHPPDIIFEDRSRVVRTYRERGLTVFQVAEGDF